MQGPSVLPRVKIFNDTSLPITMAKRALRVAGADTEYVTAFVQKIMSAKDRTEGLFIMSQYVRLE